ncbi:MAG: DUF1043 family protein [Ectothiorhodospiraceae bacterium]|nr:DUF1043 family protein [Ectothiorhodospiraceae bacterium]
MSTFSWLFVLVVAILVSFVAGRMAAPRTGRLKALEQERDAASAELRRYREEVSAHFEKTATLFNEVTGRYRNLYEHLAEGSQRLGLGPDAHLLQTSPERRRLEGSGTHQEGDDAGTGVASPADGPASAAEPASEERTSPEQPAAERVSEERIPPEQPAEAGTPSPDSASEETTRSPEGPGKADGEPGQRTEADSRAADKQTPDADDSAPAETSTEAEPRPPSDYAPDDAGERPEEKTRRKR